MEKSSSSCKVEGCPNHPRYCGFCDRHYREQEHRPYTKHCESKLFDFLPEKTKRKLMGKQPARCAICRKELVWPDIVLFSTPHKCCKKCYREIVRGVK